MRKALGISLLFGLFPAVIVPTAFAQQPSGYWLYVDGAWKGGFVRREDCNAAAAKMNGKAECHAVLRSPTAPRPSSSRPPASVAQCDVRARAWVATLPCDATFTKYDLADAIGGDCDVEELSKAWGQALAASGAIIDECTRRWRAGGDPSKTYNTSNPAVRQEIWLDIPRAAGNACADALTRMLFE